MKTPMQLLYEQLERTVIQQKSMMSIGEYESFKAGMEMAIAIIEQDGHFEREKEAMYEFGLLCTSNGSLHEIDYVFNETFKTKEK